MKHCGRCNSPYAGHDCRCPCHLAKAAEKAAEHAAEHSFICLDCGDEYDLDKPHHHHKH